jgi:hypothetical protein
MLEHKKLEDWRCSQQKPAYDFAAESERLMSTAFLNRNIKYNYYDGVELHRKGKGVKLAISETGKN